MQQAELSHDYLECYKQLHLFLGLFAHSIYVYYIMMLSVFFYYSYFYFILYKLIAF